MLHEVWNGLSHPILALPPPCPNSSPPITSHHRSTSSDTTHAWWRPPCMPLLSSVPPGGIQSPNDGTPLAQCPLWWERRFHLRRSFRPEVSPPPQSRASILSVRWSRRLAISMRREVRPCCRSTTDGRWSGIRGSTVWLPFLSRVVCGPPRKVL